MCHTFHAPSTSLSWNGIYLRSWYLSLISKDLNVRSSLLNLRSTYLRHRHHNLRSCYLNMWIWVLNQRNIILEEVATNQILAIKISRTKWFPKYPKNTRVSSKWKLISLQSFLRYLVKENWILAESINELINYQIFAPGACIILTSLSVNYFFNSFYFFRSHRLLY